MNLAVARLLLAAALVASALLVPAGLRLLSPDRVEAQVAVPEGSLVPLGLLTAAQVTPLGGIINSPDGKISLTFPPGAVSEPVNVTFTPLHPWVWGAPGMRVVDMFELKASAPLRGDAAVTQFSADVEIAFSLSRDYHLRELRGLDINSFGLYFLDGSTGAWVPLPGALTREGAPRLTSKTRHFSIFGGQAAPIISGPGAVLGFQNDLHSGAATARLPIEVPPGPGGFAPTLGLAYNSGSADEMKNKRDVGSWAGIGWSLRVGRLSANPETSRWYLDLNDSSYELVPDPSASGVGRYRTKVESGLKVLYTPAQPKWEVWDRNGAYYLFDVRVVL